MPIHSIYGKLAGIDTNTGNFISNGRIMGGSTPTGLGRGKTFYVDSAIAATDGTSPESASATIVAATAKCTANQGDTIVVMPGHAETIAAATALTAVAGITIIGLGQGAQRPTISFSTLTTAAYTLAVANVTIINMRFVSTFADVVTAIALGATSSGFNCLGCFFGDSAVDLNLLSAIKSTSTTDGASNNIRLQGNSFLSQDAATLGFFIHAADILGAIIEDNTIVSEGTGLATIFTSATGKDIRMCSVRRNVLSSKATAGNLGWSNDTASPNNSGIIADNYVGHADVSAGHVLGVVGGCRMFNNLSVSTDALSGFVIPAVDVDN